MRNPQTIRSWTAHLKTQNKATIYWFDINRLNASIKITKIKGERGSPWRRPLELSKKANGTTINQNRELNNWDTKRDQFLPFVRESTPAQQKYKISIDVVICLLHLQFTNDTLNTRRLQTVIQTLNQSEIQNLLTLNKGILRNRDDGIQHLHQNFVNTSQKTNRPEVFHY